MNPCNGSGLCEFWQQYLNEISGVTILLVEDDQMFCEKSR